MHLSTLKAFCNKNDLDLTILERYEASRIYQLSKWFSDHPDAFKYKDPLFIKIYSEFADKTLYFVKQELTKESLLEDYEYYLCTPSSITLTYDAQFLEVDQQGNKSYLLNGSKWQVSEKGRVKEL
jgi:hypothetical protein